MTLNEMFVYFGTNGRITTALEAEKLADEVTQAFRKYAIYKVQQDWCLQEKLDIKFPAMTAGQQMAENAMRSLTHYIKTGVFSVPAEFKTQKRAIHYLSELMEADDISDKVAVYSYSPAAAYRKAAYWFGQAMGASACIALEKTITGSTPWSASAMQGFHDSLSHWNELKAEMEQAKPDPLTQQFALWAAYQKLQAVSDQLVA